MSDLQKAVSILNHNKSLVPLLIVWLHSTILLFWATHSTDYPENFFLLFLANFTLSNEKQDCAHMCACVFLYVCGRSWQLNNFLPKLPNTRGAFAFSPTNSVFLLKKKRFVEAWTIEKLRKTQIIIKK